MFLVSIFYFGVLRFGGLGVAGTRVSETRVFENAGQVLHSRFVLFWNAPPASICVFENAGLLCFRKRNRKTSICWNLVFQNAVFSERVFRERALPVFQNALVCSETLAFSELVFS